MHLHEGVSLKQYGAKTYLYHKDTDELYEIDSEAKTFLELLFKGSADLKSLDGSTRNFLLSERIITEKEEFKAKRFPSGSFLRKNVPPLKYLHAIITTSCNFRCKHCYVDFKPLHADLRKVIGVLREFEELGGLRLMVSGGEPLVHPEFRRLNELLREFTGIRKILLTNGYALSELSVSEIRKLNFEEIQVSIDGLEKTHDWIRKKGSFKRALVACQKIKKAGKHLSVATVLFKKNVDEFDQLESLVREIEPFRWTVDYPCIKDAAMRKLLLPELESATLMERSFNSKSHEAARGYACGSSLASLLPDGTLCKCDYFPELSGGNAFEAGLYRSWINLKRIKISETECRFCPSKDECHGGCRYRALIYNGNIEAKDAVACLVYGYREGS